MRSEVTKVTGVCWPPQSRASIFKQLYLFKVTSELASEDIEVYIFLVSIHEYIKNNFLTCTREIGDPTLSKNIDLKYVVHKDKQGKKMAKKCLKMFKEK